MSSRSNWELRTKGDIKNSFDRSNEASGEDVYAHIEAPDTPSPKLGKRVSDGQTGVVKAAGGIIDGLLNKMQKDKYDAAVEKNRQEYRRKK